MTDLFDLVDLVDIKQDKMEHVKETVIVQNDSVNIHRQSPIACRTGCTEPKTVHTQTCRAWSLCNFHHIYTSISRCVCVCGVTRREVEYSSTYVHMRVWPHVFSLAEQVLSSFFWFNLAHLWPPTPAIVVLVIKCNFDRSKLAYNRGNSMVCSFPELYSMETWFESSKWLFSDSFQSSMYQCMESESYFQTLGRTLPFEVFVLRLSVFGWFWHTNLFISTLQTQKCAVCAYNRLAICWWMAHAIGHHITNTHFETYFNVEKQFERLGNTESRHTQWEMRSFELASY